MPSGIDPSSGIVADAMPVLASQLVATGCQPAVVWISIFAPATPEPLSASCTCASAGSDGDWGRNSPVGAEVSIRNCHACVADQLPALSSALQISVPPGGCTVI